MSGVVERVRNQAAINPRLPAIDQLLIAGSSPFAMNSFKSCSRCFDGLVDTANQSKSAMTPPDRITFRNVTK